ncbi:MAG: hypothetical protein ABIG45_03485, partial [Bacillota bacterium]
LTSKSEFRYIINNVNVIDNRMTATSTLERSKQYTIEFVSGVTKCTEATGSSYSVDMLIATSNPKRSKQYTIEFVSGVSKCSEATGSSCSGNGFSEIRRRIPDKRSVYLMIATSTSESSEQYAIGFGSGVSKRAETTDTSCPGGRVSEIRRRISGKRSV